jgi:hypothetical protein
MKAKEWVGTYKPGDEGALLNAFAEETQKLVLDRTKNSGTIKLKDKEINTAAAATQGAIREQRQKWLAVCSKLPTLTPEMFDEAIAKAYQPKPVEAQQPEEEVVVDVKPKKVIPLPVGGDGRKLIATMKK